MVSVLPYAPAGSEVVATGLWVHQDHYRKSPTPSLLTSVALSLEKVAYLHIVRVDRNVHSLLKVLSIRASQELLESEVL